MNMLINVYLDGFTSGAASALATVGYPDPQAGELAQALVGSVRDDPLGVEVVRREIAERFAGIDTGAKAWDVTLPGGDGQ